MGLIQLLRPRGVEGGQLDICSMPGSDSRSISVQNQAAFLDPDLVLGSWFVTPAMAENVILRPTSLKHILSRLNKLQIEPKHTFISQLVPMLEPL